MDSGWDYRGSGTHPLVRAGLFLQFANCEDERHPRVGPGGREGGTRATAAHCDPGERKQSDRSDRQQDHEGERDDECKTPVSAASTTAGKGMLDRGKDHERNRVFESLGLAAYNPTSIIFRPTEAFSGHSVSNGKPLGYLSHEGRTSPQTGDNEADSR